ncbi:patatin-like phospholipase family protein [Bdellovibrio svalbardensis]|uniref:Patatin-like phospholipase family protein n=1 Tax=Bdellovibrio svalbardensis TaxID=2972972 RepID=A0ABT6DJX5_9BACT|nr:patatin-like phospholipase family protein [Bdellovibrio svalbardensis]MDG0817155.1 patatin-like phospholipase family protein [Bdellovibrio svalbardensis]
MLKRFLSSPILKTALALFCFLNSGQALAKRPRIGLVLGGGGARGFSHVGVIKVLEENRIPVDCIVGTSIGSLVGASYAAGRTPKEMQEQIEAVDWDDILSSEVPRQANTFRKKQDDSLSLLGLEAGITDKGELKLPLSAISTQKIEFFLRTLTFGGTTPTFDQLSIPYRAIATDLATGDMIVLKDGDLVTAMRASMAVPGVFPSVPVKGHTLVDGGLVRNLPVDIARQTCADVVIAIDVGSPPLKSDELNDIFTVADQYTRLMMIQNVYPQIKSLSADDLLITPQLGLLSSSDFKQNRAFIDAGEAAARAALPQLKRYSVSPAEYKTWQDQHFSKRLKPAPVKNVIVSPSKWVNPEVMKGALDVKPGALLPQQTFHSRLLELYARGDYSQLDYELLYNPEGQTVSLLPVEKSWGPNYLNFGLSLGTDFQGSSPWNIAAMYRRTWVNSLGAEWKTIAQMGSSTLLSTEFYQPLQLSGYAFTSPYLVYTENPLALWKEDSEIAEYRYSKTSTGIDIGSGWTRFGEVRFGPLYSTYRGTRQIGSALLPDVRTFDYGLRLNLLYDQLDHFFFPRSGQYLNIYGYYSLGGEDVISNYNRYGLNFRAAIPTGRGGAFQVTLKGQNANGDRPAFVDVNWLGGFLNLSSYRYQQLIGDQYAYGSLQYYKMFDFLSGSYWGLAMEGGRLFNPVDPSVTDAWHSSVTAYLAYDSILGPLYFGGSYGDNHQSRFYLMLGKQF